MSNSVIINNSNAKGENNKLFSPISTSYKASTSFRLICMHLFKCNAQMRLAGLSFLTSHILMHSWNVYQYFVIVGFFSKTI